MVVERNIPQPADIISVSQDQLLQNNQGYVDTFAVDHGPYNDANAGKHLRSTYPIQASDPVTLAGEGKVYAKDSTALTGRTDLYYRYQTAGGTSMTGLVCPLLAIKAFGKADLLGTVAGTAFNCTVSAIAGNVWTITITSPFVSNADAQKMMVLAVPESAATTNIPILGVLITNETTITVRRTSTAAGGAAGVSVFSFAILAL